MIDYKSNYDHKGIVKLAKAKGAVSFSDYAKFALLHYYDNRKEFVGTKSGKASSYHVRRRMDCITLVLRCLDVAYRGMGDASARSKIWTFDATGALIQKYLVDSKNFTGVFYLNKKSQPLKGRGNASKNCKYFGVKASYLLSDYQDAKAELFPFVYHPNAVDGVRSLAALNTVKFGFGISFSGDHTWLISEGMIYESHWSKVGTSPNGPSGLFEKRSVRDFTKKWSDGMIVVPSSEANKLAIMPKITCP